MTMIGQSFLVLSENSHRRKYIADTLRAVGAVSVEAVSLQRAQAILKQLQFDVLAIDFVGLDVGVIDFLYELRVDHPATAIFIVSPPVDGRVLARLQVSGSSDSPETACPIRIVNEPRDATSQITDVNDASSNSSSPRRVGRNGRQT